MKQGKPDFADLLRQWRIYKNWTQEQMGEALSRSKRTITYWENGAITKIPINHVAHCLGITTAEFLAGPYPADKQIETETAPAKIRDLKLMELPELSSFLQPSLHISDPVKHVFCRVYRLDGRSADFFQLGTEAVLLLFAVIVFLDGLHDAWLAERRAGVFWRVEKERLRADTAPSYVLAHASSSSCGRIGMTTALRSGSSSHVITIGLR